MKIILLLILISSQYNLKSQDTLNTTCIVNIKGKDEVKENINYQIIINKTNVYFNSDKPYSSFKLELKDTIEYERSFYNEIHTISCNLPNCTFKIEKIDNKISMVAIKNETRNYYVFYLKCDY
jgi:hypothetical protein